MARHGSIGWAWHGKWAAWHGPFPLRLTCLAPACPAAGCVSDPECPSKPATNVVSCPWGHPKPCRLHLVALCELSQVSWPNGKATCLAELLAAACRLPLTHHLTCSLLLSVGRRRRVAPVGRDHTARSGWQGGRGGGGCALHVNASTQTAPPLRQPCCALQRLPWPWSSTGTHLHCPSSSMPHPQGRKGLPALRGWTTGGGGRRAAVHRCAASC